MKRLVLALTVSAATLLATAPAVASNPHHEEADGCDHGATGKACRPDPSSNGKDCEVHGNHGGVNEDHCDQEVPTSTTTTTAPRTPITGPIELEVIEITTTTTMPAPTTTTTTGPASPTTTVTTSGGATGSPSTTTTHVRPAPPTSSTPATSGPAELPATGSSTLPYALLGLALLLTGIGCIICGDRMTRR